MILVIVAVYFLTLSGPSVIESIISENLQEQANETPSESTQTALEQTEGTNNTTVEKGGGGLGGVGGEEEVNDTFVKVNYTLTVDSFPEGLRILTNYSINGTDMTFEDYAPFTVLVESGETACVLLTSNVKGGTVINWLLDGNDCEAYPCSGFIGCGIYMNGNHVVSVHYSTPEIE